MTFPTGDYARLSGMLEKGIQAKVEGLEGESLSRLAFKKKSIDEERKLRQRAMLQNILMTIAGAAAGYHFGKPTLEPTGFVGSLSGVPQTERPLLPPSRGAVYEMGSALGRRGEGYSYPYKPASAVLNLNKPTTRGLLNPEVVRPGPRPPLSNMQDLGRYSEYTSNPMKGAMAAAFAQLAVRSLVPVHAEGFFQSKVEDLNKKSLQSILSSSIGTGILSKMYEDYLNEKKGMR